MQKRQSVKNIFSRIAVTSFLKQSSTYVLEVLTEHV